MKYVPPGVSSMEVPTEVLAEEVKLMNRLSAAPIPWVVAEAGFSITIHLRDVLEDARVCEVPPVEMEPERSVKVPVTGEVVTEIVPPPLPWTVTTPAPTPFVLVKATTMGPLEKAEARKSTRLNSSHSSISYAV